jgi:hypothetical protein
MTTYAQARADRLLVLLEDPESWRTIRDNARDVARQHQVGTEAHITLTRLAGDVDAVLDLAGRDTQRDAS